jgi:DNA modification methylase
VTISILQGDCRETMRGLPAESVHTCVTSPPYWGLRDYGVEGQLGLEATPEEYVAKMVEVFREVKRVLRDDGTLWLNLGDSYARNAAKGGSGFGGKNQKYLGDNYERARAHTPPGMKEKDLVGIPWMVAFALRADGWYLRSDIIWHKPNPMPESVTDRCTRNHEYIFMLTKKPVYFYDADAIKDPWKQNENDIKRATEKHPGYEGKHKDGYAGNVKGQPVGDPSGGANKRSVWTVTTKAFKGAHFATFPPDLIEPCIKAGSSEKGCCPTCGAPWERVVVDTGDRREVEDYDGQARKDYKAVGVQDPSETKRRILEGQSKVTRSDWAPSCTCPLIHPVPCTVLDPFGGAGTTGLVSDRLNRHAILCELNPAYIDIAERRLNADSPLFASVETEPA